MSPITSKSLSSLTSISRVTSSARRHRHHHAASHRGSGHAHPAVHRQHCHSHSHARPGSASSSVMTSLSSSQPQACPLCRAKSSMVCMHGYECRWLCHRDVGAHRRLCRMVMPLCGMGSRVRMWMQVTYDMYKNTNVCMRRGVCDTAHGSARHRRLCNHTSPRPWSVSYCHRRGQVCPLLDSKSGLRLSVWMDVGLVVAAVVSQLVSSSLSSA